MPKVFEDYFYFVRHGETENNALGLVTGVKDIPLNDAGITQASKAVHCVSALGIKSCICSSLMRAVQTAVLMLQKTGVTPVLVDGFKERDWGKLECTSKKELDNFVFSKMGVEPWGDFVKRNIEAVHSLTVEPPVLIVAHSGTFRALCDYLKIHIEKRPVINAWPYCFFKTGAGWNVTIVDNVQSQGGLP